MNEMSLFNNTKLAAYFIWEQTGCEFALDLWLCAEDLACFFEQANILDNTQIENIRRLDKSDPGYIAFIQHVSYRIYQYARRSDDWHNWFSAEKIIGNNEWVKAVTGMASIYQSAKTDQSIMNEVRSENVRAYYDEQTS